MNFLLRALKYLASFRKSDWVAEDYPLRWRRQSVEPITIRRGVVYPQPWSVQVVEWWVMAGNGKTRPEALADLQSSLDAYRDSHGTLPRPGTAVAIQFAPFEALEGYEEIAREFFPPVLGMDYDDCFITDGSSLWDFPIEESAKEVENKILLLFGVDVSDIADGNLAMIFKKIHDHRRGT